jgi:crossover junction endodeoxyribonuclease RusA
MITLQLAYPDSALSPNSPKRHWRAKQAQKLTAKTEAYYKAFPFRETFECADALQMSLTIYPPTNARRDLDNVFASMKSAIDGVCQGLAIDDSQIRRVTLEWGTVVKSGAVELELRQYGGK